MNSSVKARHGSALIRVAVVAGMILAQLQPPASAAPGDTHLASVTSDEQEANGWSRFPVVSDDGRYVVFESNSSNIDPRVQKFSSHLYIRDLLAGTTELVNVSNSGEPANNASWAPAISADGRYVAFLSNADNLVPLNVNVNRHTAVYVRDRVAKTTSRVSVDSFEVPINHAALEPSISDDGTKVAFVVQVPSGALRFRQDVYVRDLAAGTTKAVTIARNGLAPDGHSFAPAISGDGRWVAFHSWATNLVENDTNKQTDVFVANVDTGRIERVSVGPSAAQGNGTSFDPSISDDGTKIAFTSFADNIVADSNFVEDVVVWDRTTGQAVLASQSYGAQGNASSYDPSMSGDGRYVAYASDATNLAFGDTNEVTDIYLTDLASGIARRVSISSQGAEGNRFSSAPDVADGGGTVAFESYATNLVPGVTYGGDVYVHEVDLAEWPKRHHFKPGRTGPKSPRTHPQHFYVYDAANDGLQDTDPIIGRVDAVANPQGRDILQLDLQLEGAVPDCTLEVSLMFGSEGENGGLSGRGRFPYGSVVLGTVSTDQRGSGAFSFAGDVDPSRPTESDPELKQRFGFIAVTSPSTECYEADRTRVDWNEYGGAPQPMLQKPFTWFQ